MFVSLTTENPKLPSSVRNNLIIAHYKGKKKKKNLSYYFT